MTKQELVGQLNLIIDKIGFVYGQISINEPVGEALALAEALRNRVAQEGVSE
jgi:hypothetical protein